ncbi:hypothetical protein AVEN_14789-1 [Araneus ventricosus]|uniref:Uncharacterized protein n=1 Tax=Araneus ventricosus TaxID=182803 RepID=A0A4Y2FMK8_ARAVE|nr:hypothetical protein AVEN_14789-1 [Araneus ventricosus]
MVRLADRFSALYRKHKKQLHWSRECIQFATGHGPFPSYLKRFDLHPTDYFGYGEIGNPLHYATKCPLISPYHFKEPSPQFTIHCSKRVLSSKLSRRKIDHLIKFLKTNEDLIKNKNYNTDTNSSLEIDSYTDSPPGTRNSMNSRSSSRAF